MYLTDHASVRRALEIADLARELLAARGVPGELVLTGGSSLPGLLTKGDIDLHLRVPAAQFDVAVERLRLVAEAVRTDIWSSGFATFERSDEPVVGIAATVVGSEHDVRFTTGWARLAEDAVARGEYNALKTAGNDESAKSTFFDRFEPSAGRSPA